MPIIDVAIAIILRGGKVLLCQRRHDNPVLPGLWEFPGGKKEPAETIQECLHRELAEEIAMGVELRAELPVVEHPYPTRRVRLHPIVCAHRHGEPQPIACERTLWVQPEELENFDFPPANDEVLQAFQKWLAGGHRRGGETLTANPPAKHIDLRPGRR